MAGDSIIYSATDLASAARCEYALLREFDAKLGWGQRLTVTDELLERTAALGDQHEQRRLDQLRDEHGGDVAVIGRPFPFTVANVTAAAAQTQRKIEDGAAVIYQAAMFDGRFVGFADFLVRRDAAYQVSDTKLARSAKVTALLQIAAYADTLSQSGIAGIPKPSSCSATASRSITGSTSWCRCTASNARDCSACSTITTPAGRRCVGTTRTCGLAFAVRS